MVHLCSLCCYKIRAHTHCGCRNFRENEKISLLHQFVGFVTTDNQSSNRLDRLSVLRGSPLAPIRKIVRVATASTKKQDCAVLQVCQCSLVYVCVCDCIHVCATTHGYTKRDAYNRIANNFKEFRGIPLCSLTFFNRRFGGSWDAYLGSSNLVDVLTHRTEWMKSIFFLPCVNLSYSSQSRPIRNINRRKMNNMVFLFA